MYYILTVCLSVAQILHATVILGKKLNLNVFINLMYRRISRGGYMNFHLGAIAHGVWETEFRERIPCRGGFVGRSPPKAEGVCRHCVQILTAETIKI